MEKHHQHKIILKWNSKRCFSSQLMSNVDKLSIWATGLPPMEILGYTRGILTVLFATNGQRCFLDIGQCHESTVFHRTRPDTWHKMRLECVLFTFEDNTGYTDGRTYGRTDLRTDGHDLLQRCDGASKNCIYTRMLLS